MTRRDHLLVFALATIGLVVCLWLCWYVYLPPEAAASVDWCRLTPHIDCFESLSKYGASIKAGWFPAIGTMTALFAYQVLLALAAWLAPAGVREAWIGIARLVAFPTAGLAIFILLHDYSVAKVTSVSALALAGVSLALCVDAVLRGIRGVRLTAGLRGTLGLLVVAGLFGFFLHGAGSARLEIDRLMAERESAPPNIRYVDFAQQLPRTGAASLGNATAPAEVVLFVDPSDPASRAVMREAADLAPEYADRVFMYIVATGEYGPKLLLAHRAGMLERYLRTLAEPPGDPATVRDLAERQERARLDLGITKLPTAIWGKHPTQRATGDFKLRDVLEQAAFRHE